MADSWVDTSTNQRLYQPPYFWRDERRPASPRTMQRRFSAMDKKLERKTAEYRAALRRTRSAQAAGGDVLKEWARSLRTLVQASLCKDVLHAGMSQLEKVH